MRQIQCVHFGTPVDHRTARKWMPMLAFIPCDWVSMSMYASLCVCVLVWHSLVYALLRAAYIYVSTSNSVLLFTLKNIITSTDFTNLFTLCRFLADTFRCSHIFRCYMHEATAAMLLFRLTFFLYLFIHLFWHFFRGHWRYNIYFRYIHTHILCVFVCE